MAHIPYGYRIEMGKALRDEEQAEKLNVFLEGYLGGLSIENARGMAGINLAASSLRDYMRSGTYAGTDYYPPIVVPGMKERIAEEMEKRTFKGVSIFVPSVPVKTEFRMKSVGPLTGTAAEKAAARYAAIESKTSVSNLPPAGSSPPAEGHTDSEQNTSAENAFEKGAEACQ